MNLPRAGAASGAAAQAVEVVDADGIAVGTCTRREMRAANARHRATYVVVRRRDGAVLVHRRADWKDIWPGRWDLAFGGICEVGEAWPAAARRELAEEAGIDVDDGAFVTFGPVVYESVETRVVGWVYGCVHDGPFTFPDGEVVDHAFVPGESLAAWAAAHELTADSAAVVLPLVVEWCAR